MFGVLPLACIEGKATIFNVSTVKVFEGKRIWGLSFRTVLI